VATQTYQDADYRSALAQLATLLQAGEKAAAEHSGNTLAARLLAHAYLVTARTLIQLRHEDLGYAAIQRSFEHARHVGDEVLYATCGDSMNWVLIRQARYPEAERTALLLAESVEPRIANQTDTPRLTTYGRLCIQASSAAARNNRPTEAAHYLSLARIVADRVGVDHIGREPYQSLFSSAVVSTIEVESAMVQGDPERALSLARRIPETRWVADPASRTSAERRRTRRRHLLAIVEAQAATGQHSDALQTLMQTRAANPRWIKEQRLAQRQVRDLLDVVPVARARESGLADLASEMHIRV
jgi:hypothetical protein